MYLHRNINVNELFSKNLIVLIISEFVISSAKSMADFEFSFISLFRLSNLI